MQETTKTSDKTFFATYIAIWAATLAWSVIDVQDTYLTWVLESLPAFIWMSILVLTYKTVRLSKVLYVVMLVHMIILFVGAHYSYAKVPLGFWMEDWFGFTRNNFDKIGHFMQGVSPTLITIEVLSKKFSQKSIHLTSFLAFSVAMMVSAVYELLEWFATLTNPEDTEAFIGSQGYVWDTQSDMFMCFIGSLSTLLFVVIVQTYQVSKHG